MFPRSTTAAACAAALLVVVATPTTAVTQPFDLSVVLSSVSGADPAAAPRTKVFAAEGVTAGAGPELTADDLVSDPGGLCGAVEVDVDPAARTVTLAVPEDEVGCEVSSVVFRMDDVPEIPWLTIASDALVQGAEGFTGREGNFVTWGAQDAPLVLSGTTVLRYELAAAAAPAPAPAPDVPAPAAPARAVVAQPTFTG